MTDFHTAAVPPSHEIPTASPEIPLPIDELFFGKDVSALAGAHTEQPQGGLEPGWGSRILGSVVASSETEYL